MLRSYSLAKVMNRRIGRVVQVQSGIIIIIITINAKIIKMLSQKKMMQIEALYKNKSVYGMV